MMKRVFLFLLLLLSSHRSVCCCCCCCVMYSKIFCSWSLVHSLQQITAFLFTGWHFVLLFPPSPLSLLAPWLFLRPNQLFVLFFKKKKDPIHPMVSSWPYLLFPSPLSLSFHLTWHVKCVYGVGYGFAADVEEYLIFGVAVAAVVVAAADTSDNATILPFSLASSPQASGSSFSSSQFLSLQIVPLCLLKYSSMWPTFV